MGKNKDGAIKLSTQSIVSTKMQKMGIIKNRLLIFFQFMAIALIITGLARPRIIKSLQEKNIEVVDIVLVIDISSSMLAKVS